MLLLGTLSRNTPFISIVMSITFLSVKSDVTNQLAKPEDKNWMSRNVLLQNPDKTELAFVPKYMREKLANLTITLGGNTLNSSITASNPRVIFDQYLSFSTRIAHI